MITETATAPSDPPGPDAAPRRSRRDAVAAVAIAAVLAGVYSANGEVLPGNDATGSVYLAANLAAGRSFGFSATEDPGVFPWQLLPQRATVRISSLDEPVGGVPARTLRAEGRLVPFAPYFLTPSVLRGPGGEPLFVNTFGPGAAVAALPVIAPLRWALGDLRARPDALWLGAKLAASLLVAASAAFVFLTARRWLSPGRAAALALAYGLGTAVWTTSSQTLWQHGPAELAAAAAIFFLVRARERAGWAVACGAALGAAVACRPTLAILAGAAAVWLLVVDRRAFAALALGGIPFAAALAAYNLHHLGSPLRFGQTEVSVGIALAKTGSPDLWQTPLHVGIAGVLASPSRGVLPFSPWLALAVPGAVLAWRRRELAALRPVSVAALLVLLVEARWFDWWGGWSYGWRRLVDLAPLLAVLVAPVVAPVTATRARAAAAGVAVAWSVLVQGVGAFAYDLDGWNARIAWAVELPGGEVAMAASRDDAAALARTAGGRVSRVALDVDRPEHRHRLWSLRDGQIGYYLANFAAAREAKHARVEEWMRQYRR
ncbi:MAG TPA: glycosyltransferase family 39 protein [Anaeromyxobacter sp.]|nr:glycosyltransferase family 39 protein [Anaeromyxobacter sp.]